MPKILITGASGFIGKNLVEAACKKKYEVWAGTRKIKDKIWDDATVHLIDLCYNDKEKLKQQLTDHAGQYGKWDYIVHNAGVTKCLDIQTFDEVNFQYAANFIDALQETGLEPEKFVLMSSLSACGPFDEKNYTPISLDTVPCPNTAYGMSKLKAEQYLQAAKNVPYIILRPTGVYGPGDKDYLLMFKTIQSGIDVSMGFKKQLLTFIYVSDLVKAVFLSLEKPVVNKIYFVADGDIHTDTQFVQIVKNTLGKKHLLRLKIPICIVYIISSIAESVSRLTGKPSTLNRDKFKIMKQRNWVCDTAPLFNDLDYSPDYNLADGVKASIQWYKEAGWI